MQPPVLVRTEPLPRVEPGEAERLVWEAVAGSRRYYLPLAGVPAEVEALLAEFAAGPEVAVGGGPGGKLADYFE